MNQVLQSKFGVDHAGLAALRAGIAYCYTCGSCSAECPVNRMTSRLNPLKLVRMAAFGLFYELVRLPEIWYCLMCRRCKHICPMTVKPSMLIDFLRREAVRQHVVPPDTAQRVKSLTRQLHRIRRRAVIRAFEGETIADVAREWNHPAGGPPAAGLPRSPANFPPAPVPSGRSAPVILTSQPISLPATLAVNAAIPARSFSNATFSIRCGFSAWPLSAMARNCFLHPPSACASNVGAARRRAGSG
jgi:ferredoxin